MPGVAGSRPPTRGYKTATGETINQCTARAKHSGERCLQPAVDGYTVCHFHGGKTPKGIASPNFISGRHSGSLPARLKESYERFLADPNILSMDSEVAVTDTRLEELYTKLDVGGSLELWRSLGETFMAGEAKRQMANDPSLTEEERSEAQADFFTSYSALGMLISQIGQDERTWKEIREWHAHRKELAVAERDRVLAAAKTGQLYPVEQVLAGYTAILMAVKDHVTDRRALAAIQQRVDEIAAGPRVGNSIREAKPGRDSGLNPD